MTPPPVGRLLWHVGDDAIADDAVVDAAAGNMSVDQAIAESVSRAAAEGGDAPVTLRLYQWPRPTLSLGYFQTHGFQTHGESRPRYASLAKVRRATGGGAILHHHELTYSLVVPTPAGQRGARHDLYRGVHQAIIETLADFSVRAQPYRADPQPPVDGEAFLCFQRRTDEDLIVSGYKVVGSAQRREKRAILQHGSILFRASEFAPELPGVLDLTSQCFGTTSFGERLTAAVQTHLNVSFASDRLTADEHRRAREVTEERFGNPNWWSRR